MASLSFLNLWSQSSIYLWWHFLVWLDFISVIHYLLLGLVDLSFLPFYFLCFIFISWASLKTKWCCSTFFLCQEANSCEMDNQKASKNYSFQFNCFALVLITSLEFRFFCTTLLIFLLCQIYNWNLVTIADGWSDRTGYGR